jgi:hypothetical protein
MIPPRSAYSVMLAAIQKKIATWHIGFWGKHGHRRLEL